MLPKCPYSIDIVVNYKGKILAVSQDSKICAFDAPSNSWKISFKPSEGEIISIAVNHDTLYVYRYVCIKTKPTPTRVPALFTRTTEGWKEQDFDVKRLGSKLLLTSEHLFIESDKCIYRQKINSGSKSETKSDEPERHAIFFRRAGLGQPTNI